MKEGSKLIPSRGETAEEGRLRRTIRSARLANFDRLIILDDDPTGAQSIHSVPILTSWDIRDLEAEFKRDGDCFFIMTNSRAMLPESAEETAKLIGTRLRALSIKYNFRLLVVSRGDSTLRGHYPGEVKALARGLGWGNNYVQLICPAFFAGGRITRNGTHYVREGDQLTPVNATPYANDHSFAYENAYLPEWVAEKCAGPTHGPIVHWSRKWISRVGAKGLAKSIGALPSPLTITMDGEDYTDLQTVALAVTSTPKVKVLSRTAADFVRALLAQVPRSPLSGKELNIPNSCFGGLIVVGSHVPKTTRQLERLRELENADFIEAKLTVLSQANEKELPLRLKELTQEIDAGLKRGKTVVFFTSRTPMRVGTREENLRMAVRISGMICTVVAELSVTPAFLIAKGGITSSDLATKALGTRRAWVEGQLLPGVPVWRLDQSKRYAGLPLVVFPGNVGADDGLLRAVEKLQ